jgi:uncharacterized protein
MKQNTGNANQVYAIPVAGKVLLYRPLLRLAFVGNQAMADLTLELVHRGERDRADGPDTPASEAASFLQEIGFLEPDPPPPQSPPEAFKSSLAALLLTSRCNLRCIYCYAAGGQRTVQDLPLELALAAIDEAHRNAVELGRTRFDLSLHGGGEPVQAWDVVQKATAHARSKELPCIAGMVSNGVWSDRQRDWIVDNLDSVTISFDGAPETQDRQRPFASGKGSAKAVLRSIHALDKLGLKYGIRMTAIAPWRGQLPKDVRFICEETGCKAIQVEPAFYTERGVTRGPTQEESNAFVEGFVEAFDYATKAGRNLSFSGARPWAITRAFCSAPYSCLIINPTGDLVACFEVTDDQHPLVELSRIGSIDASPDGHGIVVDEGARAKMRAYLQNRQTGCEDCFCNWHCAGDCYVRGTLASGGDLPGSNPRCHMNREITTHMLMWYVLHGDGLWRGQGSHPQQMDLMGTF